MDKNKNRTDLLAAGRKKVIFYVNNILVFPFFFLFSVGDGWGGCCGGVSCGVSIGVLLWVSCIWKIFS